MTTKKTPTKRKPHALYFDPEDTPVKQSFKDDCDINRIVKQFTRTGQVTHLNRQPAHYGYAPALDFREALEMVREQEEQFAELPSQVRARFNNNPEELLEFLGDPENLEEARQLGLAEGEKPEVEKPESEGEEPPPSSPSSEPLEAPSSEPQA